MPNLTYATGYRSTTAARAAHDTVTAHTAADGFDNLDVDWPVSGDATLVDYGKRGLRNARGPLLWALRGVKPKHPTTGIRVGDTVELYGGETLTVEGVGTLAGFGRNEHGEVHRWDAARVFRIYPAGRPTITGHVSVCLDCSSVRESGTTGDTPPDREPWGLMPDSDVTADWDAEPEDGSEPYGVADFSWTPCEACGSTLGGSRWSYAVWEVAR